MNEKLKPCPFCGGPASIVENSFPPGPPTWWHPSCDDRDCIGFVAEQDEQGGTTCDFLTPEEAAAAWNKRPDESTIRREALEEAAAAARKECERWDKNMGDNYGSSIWFYIDKAIRALQEPK